MKKVREFKSQITRHNSVVTAEIYYEKPWKNDIDKILIASKSWFRFLLSDTTKERQYQKAVKWLDKELELMNKYYGEYKPLEK